jgi:tetratricopeptide (TPR) repeat protein
MIQFPRQTLDFRAGDCDDLSVLYGALLESVGIRSAFLTIPGHIFVAFALDMDESEARKTFSKPDDLVYIGGEAWVPVEITMVRQNFLEAWTTGAKQWRENATAKTAAHYVVRDAWQTYPPTGFSSEALGIAIPQTTEVVPNYTALLRRFVEREIAPQVSELKGRIEASNGSSRLVNRLGALYARFGLYDDAEREFLRATRFPEYLPALINLGNIAYIKKDMKNAYAYYERARSVRADDPMVLINLARVHFDLAEYDPANKRYREAEILSPEAVKEYSYIVSASKETGRASAAQTRQNVSWNEE